MERVVDLLPWFLERDDCYQSHRIASRDCNPLHISFVVHVWNVICVMCVPIANTDGCVVIRLIRQLIEILQPDTQLTWLSHTHSRTSILFGIRMISIFTFNLLWQHNACVCRHCANFSIYTYILSFIRTWLTRNDGLFCWLFWFSQCHFVVQMLLVDELEIRKIRKFWLKKTCIFSAFAKRKKMNFEAQNFYLLHSVLWTRSRF